MTKIKQKPYLTYALDADGKLIHIDSVSTGLSCNCFCPHCKNKLIAKNVGTHKVHHFAHINGSACVEAIESALHKMAKDILQQYKIVMLPMIKQSNVKEQKVFDKVKTEVFDKELSLRPDCIGYTRNEGPIWVEFKRTHEVDAKKAGKIISAKIDCIEIDLNSCELDPVKVKSFIENREDNRKWIYNHRNSNEKNANSQSTDLDDCYEYERRMVRHIAIDEQNTIVNLYQPDKIDTIKHTYYCIACGEEVVINVDNSGNYSFVHLKENTKCEDDFYLHEAAKKVLREKFNAQQKFEVYIPQQHLCEKKHLCPLFNKVYCSIDIPILFDLKAHGYDSCKIEFKLPNEKFAYDAIIQRGDDLRAAIVIVIDADTCYIAPKDIKNRIIEITARREADVFKLYKGPLTGDIIRLRNFQHKNSKTTTWEKVNRQLLKFTLFSSGKYYLGEENCMSTKRRSTIYEMVIPQFNGDYRSLKRYAVLRCYKNQKTLCLCEICYCLKHVEGLFNKEDICIRYKTKGTPRNPLETMPVKCPYFCLDKSIESQLEKEYQGIEIIEI